MDRDLTLALEFDRRVTIAGATEVIAIDAGQVIRNSALPAVRHLNTVALDAPLPAALGPAKVIALADRWLDGLPGRALRIDDEAGALRLAPALAADGWEQRRTVLMVRGAAGPSLPPPDPRARAAGAAEHTALMRAVFAETDYGPDAPVGLAPLLVDAQRAQQAGMECRRFGAGENGELQSMCELFLDPDVGGVPMAMVEQVATLRSHRVRGLAKAAIAAAMTAAIAWGAERIVVPADREDWPQIIYAGLGCETVGTLHSFFAHRPSTGTRA